MRANFPYVSKLSIDVINNQSRTSQLIQVEVEQLASEYITMLAGIVRF